MGEDKKQLRVFHVDDDARTLSAFNMMIVKMGGIYIEAYDLEDFEKEVNDGLKDFDKYRNVFISDGQFPARNDNSKAYIEVIEFLENIIDERYLKIIVISGNYSIVEDAKNQGYVGFLKGSPFIQKLKNILESE